MNQELNELISRADRGDNAAQQELMTRGDEAGKAGDHEKAAYLYRMAAIAYRINAGRISGVLSDTAGTCAWFARTIGYYDEWIKKYTKPVAPRINRLRRFKRIFDSHIFAMRSDGGEFQAKVRYLERVLKKHDVEFCTGGRINRHFYYMVRQDDYFKGFMNDIELRVVLDPIADEVLCRCLQEENGSG